MNYHDGSKYEGIWLKDMYDSKGIYTWPDGAKYEGDFKKDKQHGYGHLSEPDGIDYELSLIHI